MITLRQLRYFVAAADAGSFRAAAEGRDTLISVVSRQIASLEEQLTTDLFSRSYRGAKLTHAGEYILPVVRRILADVDHTLVYAAASARAKAGRLTIGFDLSLSSGRLREGIAAFRRVAPKVLIDLVECRAAELTSLVERDEIDAAFTLAAPISSVFTTLPLWTEPLFVALPSDHPLARQEAISWSELAAEALIFQTDGSGATVPPSLAMLLATHGLKPHLSRRMVSREALLSAVGVGFGLTIIEQSATGITLPGVVIRPIAEPDAKVHVTAVWHHLNDNPVCQKFVAELRDGVRREKRAKSRSSATIAARSPTHVQRPSRSSLCTG